MAVSLPPTIRSFKELPHSPGGGKSLARKTTPGSLGIGCGGGISLAQQTYKQNETDWRLKNKFRYNVLVIIFEILPMDNY